MLMLPRPVKALRNLSMALSSTMLKRIVIASAVLCSATPAIVSASLGGDLSTVTDDRVRIKGALIGMRQSDRFMVHEMQSASGVVVREYVANGRVFAVAWQGPWHPDLQQLLGTYFARYEQAAGRAIRERRGHGPAVVQDTDFVVERAGHARAFTGRAYLPSQIPDGVTLDRIQ